MLLTNVAIVATLILYGLFGYRRGFLVQAIELVAFVLSLGVALILFGPVSHAVSAVSPKSSSLAALIIVLFVWSGLEFAIGRLWHRYQHRVPPDIHRHPTNRLAGLGPGLLKAVVLIEVVLLVIATAPLPSVAKDQVLGASLARPFVAAGTGLQASFDQVFGKAFRDVLAIKTIKTGEEGSVDLGFTKTDGQPCSRDESRMLDLLNNERTSRGLVPLTEDNALRDVGRAHSSDMLARGYFAHNTPEGVDPFQRMEKARVDYQYAGENLAFAPTVELAHTGLMNSPGHRANILKQEYRKVGIGCIDAGIRGRMFSQEFTG